MAGKKIDKEKQGHMNVAQNSKELNTAINYVGALGLAYVKNEVAHPKLMFSLPSTILPEFL